MRRAILIALILGVACLLLYGCSSETNPVDPAGDTYVPDDSADKRPPIIHDPPPGFDQFLYGLHDRFDDLTWVERTFILKGDGSVSQVELPEHEPMLASFVVDPLYAAQAAAAAPEEWECTVMVPEKPAGGAMLFIPGNCIIYKTVGFPDKFYGAGNLLVPIEPFYYQDDYTGTFTAYNLVINEYGYPDDENARVVYSTEWPLPPEVVVHIDVPEIRDKDNGSETKGVIDPNDIGPTPPDEDDE